MNMDEIVKALTEKKVVSREVLQLECEQDGDIYGGYVFRLNAAGVCHVHSLETGELISTFSLDKIDAIRPHSNSVSFGNTFFSEGDEFPLLYSNVYNNYSSAEDRHEGICCVYRIFRENGQFSSQLVQVIQVGFVDTPLWRSEKGGDVRPYGNFVVDRAANCLHAFTMRDAEEQTRFFSFDLPKAGDGILDPQYGVRLVKLDAADIKAQFDCEYFRYLQGACCSGDLIFSVEGFSDAPNLPWLHVVSLSEKKVVADLDLGTLGLRIEPEFITVYNDRLFYSDCGGMLYELLPAQNI